MKKAPKMIKTRYVMINPVYSIFGTKPDIKTCQRRTSATPKSVGSQKIYKNGFLQDFKKFSTSPIGLLIPICHRTCVIARPKSPVRIFIRHLLRTTNRLVGEPLAQNVNRSRSVLTKDKFGNTRFVSGTPQTVHGASSPLTINQPRCGMASVVGQFNTNSVHYETVCSQHNHVPHRSIIDSELLVPGSTASQAANNLTTKADAYKKDTRVTEQTEAIGTTTVHGKTVPRYLTWKENEPRITANHVTPENFTVERSTTEAEDKEFQDSKEGKKKPMYRSPDANGKPRFISGKPLSSDKPEETNKNNEKLYKNKNDES